MRKNTKIKLFIFIGFIISITYQFEDFGVFKTFPLEIVNNKTDDNNLTDIIFYHNFTNSTNNKSIVH